jgi:ATP-dependent DNA helicase 2 subunit 1
VTKIAKSGDGISLLRQLLSSINSKAAPRRALFSLPMEIGPGLKIGIKGYIMIKRQEHVKSCYVWVGGEKVQIASHTTSHMADDTARVVEKGELRKAYKFGGDTITFTPEEFTQIRQCFGEPVIRIVGFKPISLLSLWHNTGKATFIYPSESDFVGSTRVFSALQQQLIQKKKMAIVWFIARRNAAPVVAALIPGEEHYDENGEQTMPPGLWIVPLPFADDIRQCPEQVHNLKTTEELTDIMRKVVEQLQLPKGVYDPAKYPNPDLQWFYRILQAMALEEEVPDKADDKTIPKYKQIDKRAAALLEEFGAEFDQVYEASRSASKPKAGLPVRKRAAAAKVVDDEDDEPVKPKAKRAKRETKVKDEDEDVDMDAEPEGMSDVAMAAINDKGQISKQSVAILKDFLKARKKPVAGKKIELVERVQSYLDSKGY